MSDENTSDADVTQLGGVSGVSCIGLGCMGLAMAYNEPLNQDAVDELIAAALEVRKRNERHKTLELQ